MKKAQLLCTLILAFGILSAHDPVSDSVSLGSNFVKMSFYSFANGEIANVNGKDWDLQFGTELMDADIRVNDGADVRLYKPVNSDTSNWTTWTTADTAGMTELYNSDTAWNKGAFNVLATASDPFDFGWGKYNQSGHRTTGDKIFVVRTINGNYKKILIDSLASDGVTYWIRISNLDNSSDTLVKLKKSDYPGKTSFYYAIDADEVKNIEPGKTQWDIVFRRYTSWLNPPGAYYPLTGALLNPEVTAAEARGVDQSITDYSPYPFESNISVIGWDWKTQSLSIVDTLVFFVAAQDGNIYKLVFTSYGGTANGDIGFTKTEIETSTSVAEISNINTLAVYPNPMAGDVQALFTLKNASEVKISVLDLSGKSHLTIHTQASKGLNVLTLNTAELAQGFYLLSVDDGNNRLTYKLVKN